MSVFVFLLRHIVITISLIQEQEHFHTKEFLQMSQSYTLLNGGINIVSEKKEPQHTLLFMSIKNALVF